MSHTILVIEDQDDNRRILRDLLTSAGFTVIDHLTVKLNEKKDIYEQQRTNP